VSEEMREKCFISGRKPSKSYERKEGRIRMAIFSGENL
jgi:hypothetical protein